MMKVVVIQNFAKHLRKCIWEHWLCEVLLLVDIKAATYGKRNKVILQDIKVNTDLNMTTLESA
jgi:hypothetical protein